MNIFAYRKPDDTHVFCGWSDFSHRGIRQDCFVIAPFNGHGKDVIAIPLTNISESQRELDRLLNLFSLIQKEAKHRLYAFPEKSTEPRKHAEMVAHIINEIKKGDLKKCVAARAIVSHGLVNIPETFKNLCESYPSSFVFIFHTPESGTWMGASPELLISKSGNSVESVALAATHKSGSPHSWNQKEIAEQQIVTDLISKVFESNDISVNCTGPTELKAGPVEHLKTVIKGEASPDLNLPLLVDELAPTPALAGYPRDMAINLIKQKEGFERAYYGGYCGVLDNEGNASLYVNLRSMLIEANRYCLFVGGGIMAQSEAGDEWDETCHKAETLLNKIILLSDNQ